MWLHVLFLPLSLSPYRAEDTQKQPHPLCTGDDSPAVSSLIMELTSLATATTACHGPQPLTSRSNMSVGMEAVVGGSTGQKAVGKTQPGTKLRTSSSLY